MTALINEDELLLLRGEVWLADLEPVQRGEIARARLVLVVSVSKFNNGPANLVLVLPVTTRKQGIPSHVPVLPPEAGLGKESYILCEQVQCLQRDRFLKRIGAVSDSTMKAVEDRLCILLNLFEPV